MKKYIVLVLACAMLFSTTVSAYAETIKNDEYYELAEENIDIEIGGEKDNEPYGLYLMNVYTAITKISSGKVGIRADVMCSAAVSKVQIVFTLQKNQDRHGRQSEQIPCMLIMFPVRPKQLQLQDYLQEPIEHMLQLW